MAEQRRGREKELELEQRQWRTTQIKTQTQTQTQTHAPEAKKADVVNWWTALRAKTKVQPSQALSETQAKLQQAEHTIRQMREQVCHLEDTLRTSREGVTGHKPPQDQVGVLLRDQETNTETKGPGWAGETVEKERRDAGVTTDPLEELGSPAAREREAQGHRVTAEELLESLRRMEAMVRGALETAELVREGQQRVSLVKERMDNISQRVEEALTRAVDTDFQLSVLEDRVTHQPEVQ